MQGIYFGFNDPIGHGNFDAVGSNFFDLRRPLIDDGDVEPGFGEIGADAAADGSATENCNFLFHGASIAVREPAVYTARIPAPNRSRADVAAYDVRLSLTNWRRPWPIAFQYPIL